MTTTFAPELLSRLERLANARHFGTDALVSKAIRFYLDRAEIETRKQEIDDFCQVPPLPATKQK